MPPRAPRKLSKKNASQGFSLSSSPPKSRKPNRHDASLLDPYAGQKNAKVLRQDEPQVDPERELGEPSPAAALPSVDVADEGDGGEERTIDEKAEVNDSEVSTLPSLLHLFDVPTSQHRNRRATSPSS